MQIQSSLTPTPQQLNTLIRGEESCQSCRLQASFHPRHRVDDVSVCPAGGAAGRVSRLLGKGHLSVGELILDNEDRVAASKSNWFNTILVSGSYFVLGLDRSDAGDGFDRSDSDALDGFGFSVSVSVT